MGQETGVVGWQLLASQGGSADVLAVDLEVIVPFICELKISCPLRGEFLVICHRTTGSDVGWPVSLACCVPGIECGLHCNVLPSTGALII